jgi:hypothetical protein
VETPEDPGPPFDEQVREVPGSQITKEGDEAAVPVRLGALPDLAPFGFECRHAIGCRVRSDGHEQGNLSGGLHEPAAGRKPGGRVDDDPEGHPLAGRPGGEQRIVGQGGADADHDRVHPTAELMDHGPGLLSRDPA